MLSNGMIMEIFFLSHISVGILGNLLLLLVYIYVSLTCPQQKKPMDLIFLHLSMTNIMILLSKVILLVIKIFGIKNILNYTGCKLLVYLYRVARGHSICTTCLISMFQALTICPCKSRWTWLKDRIHKNTMTFLLTFWVINSLVYIRLVPFIDTIKYVNLTQDFSVKMCSTTPHMASTIVIFNMSIITFRDLIFLILMSWASGYIVIFLYRHQKNNQHLHSNNFSSRTSHETRAIRTVLLLMICFLVFYLGNSCHSLYLSTMKKKHELLENISGFLSSCYPVFCPFLLIGRESRILSPNFMNWTDSSHSKDLSK